MEVGERAPLIRVWRRLWRRGKQHFTEAFSGELLSPQAAEDAAKSDEWREKSRRNAYRYILILVAFVLVPVIGYNFYTGETALGFGVLALFAALLLNIGLMTFGGSAVAGPPAVLTWCAALILLSMYRGQDYGLFLLFPTIAGMPVLLRTPWSIILGLGCLVVGAPLLLNFYSPMTAFIIGMSLVVTWVVSAWQMFALTEQGRRLRGMAITDPLTGVYNRRYLEMRAGKVLDNWARYKRPEALLIIDIDHFKRINDRFGHAVGDKALRALVRIVRARVRRVDTLCRFGGEEFVLLLSEVDSARALRVAEDLRRAVEQAHVLPEGRMTISVGVSDVSQARSVEHWFKLADTALYLAKRNGRNRVELATEQPVEVVPIGKTVPDWR